MYYILDENKNPVKVDVNTWAEWYEINQTTGRVVHQDHDINGYYVSTIFMGLDHSFSDNATPVLWETMIFKEGDWSDLYCRRYTNHDAALKGHQDALDIAEKGGL